VIGAITPIRREIVVPATPDRAFAFFTGEMTRWWPKEHHIGSAPIEEIVIEPHEGGRWFTRHTDGSETSTGYVAAWEPPRRVVLTWQISAEWKYDPSLITTVELNFTDTGDGGTRVALEHRDLDRYGPDAEKMHATFNEPGAWDRTLAVYAAGLAAEDA
jgi:uncharacterized protein YndB with AHSA1/START domain